MLSWERKDAIDTDRWVAKTATIELEIVEYITAASCQRRWVGVCRQLDLRVDLGAISPEDAMSMIAEMVRIRLTRILADLT